MIYSNPGQDNTAVPFPYLSLWRNYTKYISGQLQKHMLCIFLRGAYIERNEDERPRKARKRATKRKKKLKTQKRKTDRLWRAKTNVLKLKKSKKMLAILKSCTLHGSPLFPETVNHLITHFLGGAYSYHLNFWGNVYKLRVCGYARLNLQYCLELMTHAYGISNGLGQYPKFATKKRNLLFLKDINNAHSALKITKRQSIEDYAPREKNIGHFEEVILTGVVDWFSAKRYETKIQLGNYKTKPKW